MAYDKKPTITEAMQEAADALVHAQSDFLHKRADAQKLGSRHTAAVDHPESPENKRMVEMYLAFRAAFTQANPDFIAPDDRQNWLTHRADERAAEAAMKSMLIQTAHRMTREEQTYFATPNFDELKAKARIAAFKAAQTSPRIGEKNGQPHVPLR